MMYVNGREVTPTHLVQEKHNYSTEEQVVGTWIDGKPLYEKTLELNFTIDNWVSSGRYFLKDITDLVPNAEVIMFKGGYCSNRHALNLSYNATHAQYIVNVNVYATSIRLYLGGDRSNTEYAGYTYYITVQYTKTTDTGGN